MIKNTGQTRTKYVEKRLVARIGPTTIHRTTDDGQKDTDKLKEAKKIIYYFEMSKMRQKSTQFIASSKDI